MTTSLEQTYQIVQDLPRNLPSRLTYLLEHQTSDKPHPYDNREPFVDIFAENRDEPYSIL